MAAKTTPAATVTRKPDDNVGSPGTPPVGGGYQTTEQAEITRIEAEGRSDTERERSWETMSGLPGQAPFSTGGASAGHADQKSVLDDRGMVAAGHYNVEKCGRSDAME